MRAYVRQLAGVFGLLLPTFSAHAAMVIANQGTGPQMASISISGDISKGDAARFHQEADDLSARAKYFLGSPGHGVPAITITLNSAGGDVMEAIKIGREVRAEFMLTNVPRNGQCSSACAFILIAGVNRLAFGKVGLHRPSFDPSYFSNLSPTDARRRYNSLIQVLRHYWVDEMGGSTSAFREIMDTTSTDVHYPTEAELIQFGIIGSDPAWDEYNEAQFIERYGRERWALIKRCMLDGNDIKICESAAYKRFP